MSAETTSVANRPGGRVLAPGTHVAVPDEGDLFGTAEVEMVTVGGLEPCPPPSGRVEHGGVGDLELAH